MLLSLLDIETVELNVSPPRGKDGCHGYVRELEGACDILMLPLGLPDCLALHIAQEMYRQNARFRSLLFTGSYTARLYPPVPPFDVVVAWRKTGFIQGRREFDEALRLAASAPLRPNYSCGDLDAAIAGILKRETCFWSDKTLAPAWTLAQYQAGLNAEAVGA